MLRLLIVAQILFQAIVLNAQHSNDHLPFYSDKFRQLDKILPTPNVYRNAAGAPGPSYWQQQVDYSIEAFLDEESQSLSADMEISYLNNSPDELSFVWLQLDQNRNRPNSLDNMTRIYRELPDGLNDTLSVNFADLSRYYYIKNADLGYDIGAVALINGEPLSYTVVGTLMRVDLPEILEPNRSVEFTISYQFKMRDGSILRSRGGYESFPDERDGEGNYSFMVAQWFPRMVAYTDYEGWNNKEYIGRGEFTLEFGNYQVSINVPDDHIVSATGELQNAEDVLTSIQLERLAEAQNSERPVYVVTPEEAARNKAQQAEGRKIWFFEASNVRDFAWASSRNFIWDAKGFHQPGSEQELVMAMSFYPVEGMPIWNDYSTEVIVHAMEVYNRFSFNYPYPTAQSVSAGFLGGMEYPMITFNGPRSELNNDGTRTYTLADKRFFIGVIIHEIGHIYFPMTVNSDERQWTWMDEGINSFLDGIASREWDEDIPWTGVEPRDITNYMRSTNQVPIMTNAESVLNPGPNAYSKPAAALNILREVILGRDLFDFAFREYSRRWKFKRPTPSDFFRTIEEASGVDLDWFWRGWFYTTDHVDISIDRVFELELNTLDPNIDFNNFREIEKSIPRTYFDTQNQNEERTTWIERNPDMKDFYDEYDQFTVTDVDRQRYERFLDSLEPWEVERFQEIQESDDFFYLVEFSNLGGLVMPILMEIGYEDQSSEVIKLPAEIWRYNSATVNRMLISEKRIIQIAIDPTLETADVNIENNYYPRRIIPSRIEIYKQAIERTPTNRDLMCELSDTCDSEDAEE